ncbi:hypothetical protein Goarm_017219 [Gossypium armourianum]|uniref:Uncharacterized protein n=1 Tax=Gossypium armourianum TaxID=34283 RepID=A0A7J9JEN8_9ROSI|nr:hypothetical protein [Gossypium armourianum]
MPVVIEAGVRSFACPDPAFATVRRRSIERTAS